MIEQCLCSVQYNASSHSDKNKAVQSVGPRSYRLDTGHFLHLQVNQMEAHTYVN